MSNTKDTPMDYKQCECGGDIIMFTPDLDICKKCGKPYEPGAVTDLLKENKELKLELQKQKELNAELVKIKDLVEELIEVSHFRNQWEATTEAFESLIKKSNEI